MSPDQLINGYVKTTDEYIQTALIFTEDLKRRVLLDVKSRGAEPPYMSRMLDALEDEARKLKALRTATDRLQSHGPTELAMEAYRLAARDAEGSLERIIELRPKEGPQ